MDPAIFYQIQMLLESKAMLGHVQRLRKKNVTLFQISGIMNSYRLWPCHGKVTIPLTNMTLPHCILGGFQYTLGTFTYFAILELA